MTDVTVGVMHMPRTWYATALTTMALVVSGLALSAPAQAGWSRPGGLTHYRVCRAATGSGDTWRFVSRVHQRGSADARAGIRVDRGEKRRATWSTGWLDTGETKISTVRVLKAPGVEVTIWQEAGDRDSSIGTAMEAIVLKPRQIRHC
ncbi:MAG: hypothetical protein ACXWDL_12115 [Nocardioides sp.]